MVIDPPVRWGVIGTGGITQKFLGGARLTSSARVVAVGSRSGARATSFAAEHGIERVHASYEAFLADPGIEAVYVSLPNALHHEWTMAALSAGKHVLCEKPYSPRPADVEAAFDAAKRTGRLLTEAFMYRHNPQTARLTELVAAGAIGDLRVIRSTFTYLLLDHDNIRLRPDVEGGALMDVGCYCVSGSRLLGGEPDVVYGQQFTGPTGTDWVFTGSLRFPGDVLATFDCGTSVAGRDELEAIGTEGSLFLDDPWHCRSPVIELRRDGEVERIEITPEDSYRLELENLGAAIRGEAKLLLGREDAVAQARVIEALYRSATEQRPSVLRSL